jgi:hypothetical protein
MRKWRLGIAWVLALLLIALLISRREAVRLVYRYKPGQVWRYNLKTFAETPYGPISSDQTIEVRVTEVRADGQAIFADYNLGGTGTASGKTYTFVPGGPIRYSRRANGMLGDYDPKSNPKPALSPGVTRALASVTLPLLPNSPVRAGASWTSVLPSKEDGIPASHLETSFDGTGTYEGRQVWKLHQVAQLGGLKVSGKYLLDKVDCSHIRSEQEIRDHKGDLMMQATFERVEPRSSHMAGEKKL